MRVAIQFDKFESRTEDFCGLPGFEQTLGRRAVRAGFAARTDHKMSGAAGSRLQGNDGAATEFDVIRMRAESQQPGSYCLDVST